MAISLGFGILFATGIILVIVPCLYLALEDVMGILGKDSPVSEEETEMPRGKVAAEYED